MVFSLVLCLARFLKTFLQNHVLKLFLETKFCLGLKNEKRFSQLLLLTILVYNIKAPKIFFIFLIVFQQIIEKTVLIQLEN